MEPLQKLFEKYVGKVLEFRRLNCRELVVTSELNGVTSLCILLEALATVENGVSKLARAGLLHSRTGLHVHVHVLYYALAFT